MTEPTPANMPRHRTRIRNRGPTTEDDAELADLDGRPLRKAKQLRAENRRLRQRLRAIEKLTREILKEF
ncbi:hypothetical protein H7J77_12305 [Mycolicibacillus parakoreensis]|uniref:Transposase n=1 Tax=Mycolicibacillus parakoreensis TaxID=1069221 RepID=A0ABY3U0A0_9MYCO|nr:hypothetical protein [Mycolicibacillus parakoreensis]MCV7316318.1 hypothetical protein [Mycolicibacillus parakoreensis]ULN52564.1 hypothetical protein MIU77_17285 [Mycolicibacillus parakoreensis]